MIVQHTQVVGRNEIATSMWNGLRRFHHTPLVTEEIINRFKVPQKYIRNVEKQSHQIRHCLIQAREYRDAAAVVSLSTRPLLLYYSVMSLALAQILLKSDGNSSLDKARGENAHHGLVFSPGGAPRGKYYLSETASQLRARPMIAADGQRKGTFELWQRTSREDPIGGYITQRESEGTRTEFSGLMGSLDKRFGVLPASGVSLLECFQALPGMHDAMQMDRVPSNVVRGKASVDVFENGNINFKFIIHPTGPKQLENLLQKILLAPKDFEAIKIIDLRDSVIINISHREDSPTSFILPPVTTWSTDEIRFLPPETTLNEFGLLYVGLYMLGNYARYYPDRWVADVDAGSPLARASEIFLDMAEWRIALLTYSDFSGKYCVPGA